MLAQFTLPANERLKHKKRIGELFQKGSSFFVFPFKVYYIKTSSAQAPSFPKVLISVPKKRLKKATDRNRVKRLIRENYRLQKHILRELDKKEQLTTIAFVYSSKELMEFKPLQKAMLKALKKIAETID